MKNEKDIFALKGKTFEHPHDNYEIIVDNVIKEGNGYSIKINNGIIYSYQEFSNIFLGPTSFIDPLNIEIKPKNNQNIKKIPLEENTITEKIISKLIEKNKKKSLETLQFEIDIDVLLTPDNFNTLKDDFDIPVDDIIKQIEKNIDLEKLKSIYINQLLKYLSNEK